VRSHGRSERCFITVGEEKEYVSLEDSEASPARPSDEDSMKLETLRWWIEIVT
jgi:hypothetical protein